ncbi:MAG TPA: glycosyltransferase family 2 protein [Methylomirabilota bacterium]|nr:glycosyltransferase family 2 protein [Methylomirabilota bacterium]
MVTRTARAAAAADEGGPLALGKEDFLPRRCLAVIMPVFNEVATVVPVLRKVLDQACVKEVLVVDDGSTDGTGERIRKWARHHPRVRLLSRERNRGKGAAIRWALEVVTAPVTIIQDADLEYDPGEYEKLLEPIRREGVSVVYGSRFLDRRRALLPKWQLWCNRSLTTVANWITRLRLTDEATCFKVFRTELLRQLRLEEDGFGFCPEVTAKLARRGIRIAEVPISYRARSRAEGKKLRWRDGVDALRCLLSYTFPRAAAREVPVAASARLAKTTALTARRVATGQAVSRAMPRAG